MKSPLNWKRQLVGAACAAAAMAWSMPAHAVTYNENGGQVVVEAEFFSSRTASANDAWTVKPGENSGTTISDGGPIIANARGVGYVQSLADNLTPGSPTVPPTIEYTVKINDPGTYQLYLRWDGNGTNGTTAGQSDSIFADIVELKDGAGGTIADHYEFTQSVNGDFASPAWDGGAGFEQNQASASNGPATWDLAAGTYNVRISQREDGSAVDAFVLQKTGIAAPTGDGPNSSQVLGHNVSLTSTEDAFVRLGQPTTNFGGAGNLLVKNSGDTTTTRQSYVKFDLGELNVDTIVDANLTFEVAVNNNGGNPLDPTPKPYVIELWGLNDGIGENWDESTINWNNAPGNDTSTSGVNGDATFLGSFVMPAINPDLTNEPVIVTFENFLHSSSTDALLNFLRNDTDGQVTFLLTREAGLSNNFGFFSKEGNGLAPTLSLYSTNPIPEPATAMLGVLGAAGLMLRRRRLA